MKKVVLMFIPALICGVMLTNCKRAEQNKEIPIENIDTIEKILIQFFPSFNKPSLMLLDLSKEQVTFQRIGLKNDYRALYAPKSLNFQIDSLFHSYFKGISFNEEDFIDKKNYNPDGIHHTVLYIFKSGRIEDIDLINGMTENEYKLIIRLIDISIVQSTDSLITTYLKDLREYHSLFSQIF